MDSDGNLRTAYLTQGNMDGGVWNGIAIVLGCIQDFNPLDNVDHEEIIEFLEYEEKLQEFIDYLKENDYIENESEVISYTWMVQKWNPELWQQYCDELEDYYITEHAGQFAYDSIEQTVEELTYNAQYETT